MKSRLEVGLAAITLLGIAFASIHPSAAVRAPQSVAPLLLGAEVPASVGMIIARSCQNCHSERTVWPWYSYLPPVSWMIERDVHQARNRMNLSRWQDYTTEQQMEILSRLAAEVRNHQMPIRQYLFLHPEARLSESDIRQLSEWAHNERRRLRSVDAPSRKTPTE
jgi:cytochrome c